MRALPARVPADCDSVVRGGAVPPRRWQAGLPKPMVALLAAILAALLAAGSGFAASNPYSGRGRGFDVSWPQCGQPAPAGHFGVVGIDHGRPFDPDNQYGPNPCLAAEYAYSPPPKALYLNTGYDPTYYTNHQVQQCVQTSQTLGLDTAHQQAWGVGCAQAWFNEQYALGTGANRSGYAQQGLAAPAVWWLDVETANSWSTSDLSLNAETLRGAAAELAALTPGVPVGVYSTASQWASIVGGNQVAGVSADWVATGLTHARGATAYCTRSFSGQPVWLVQWVYRGAQDYDIAC